MTLALIWAQFSPSATVIGLPWSAFILQDWQVVKAKKELKRKIVFMVTKSSFQLMNTSQNKFFKVLVSFFKYHLRLFLGLHWEQWLGIPFADDSLLLFLLTAEHFNTQLTQPLFTRFVLIAEWLYLEKSRTLHFCHHIFWYTPPPQWELIICLLYNNIEKSL